MRCLHDIINDEHISKYGDYSDVDITNAASLGDSATPHFAYEFGPPPPEPEPPPSTLHIHIVDVHPHEYSRDEQMPPGTPYIDDLLPDPPLHVPNTDHLMWTSYIFPTSDLFDNSITPATILTLLANDDSSRFTSPITDKFLALHHFRLQVDGGANRSVTNNRDCLHTYWDIKPYTIGGIGSGIVCTGKGIFHLICDDDLVIPITMFFSSQATETVISPTDAVFSNSTSFDSWWQMADCATGTGHLRFYKSNEITIATIPLVMRNRLWYLEQDITSTVYRAKIAFASDAFVHSMYGSTLHNLWHHRLCHAGQFATFNIDKVVDGVPSLRKRNPFFSCHDCSKGKMTAKIKGSNKDPHRATTPGGRFNMDYGFVRGAHTTKNEDGPLITSKQGYNCYLLIADEFSRHLWIFLFADKKPPIATVTSFLNTHGNKAGLRRVRTDQGGELAKSSTFRTCINKAGYTLETTGAGASFQNAIAERPHRTLADMMRTMLSGANLTSDYWSHTLRHAVYIKNWLPHRSLPGHITPFQAYSSRRPDLSHIRVFGSHVTVKHPRVCRTKLDATHTTTGIFLGFTPTNRNIWFEDNTTGELKCARHAIFDEAHYSSDNRPPYAAKLMELAEEHLAMPTLPEPARTLPLHLIPNDDAVIPPPDHAHDAPITTTSPHPPSHPPHVAPIQKPLLSPPTTTDLPPSLP